MRTILLTLFACFPLLALAQRKPLRDSTNFEQENVYVANITCWVQHLFPNRSLYSPSYVFGYRRFFGGKNALRVNFHAHLSASDKIKYGDDGYPRYYSRSRLVIGVGYERHVVLSKKWSCYYGGELGFWHYKFARASYERYLPIHYSRKSQAYGVVPLAGIVFRVSRVFSFGTEISYLVGYSKNIYHDRLSDQYTRDEGYGSFFGPPTCLFLRLQI